MESEGGRGKASLLLNVLTEVHTLPSVTLVYYLICLSVSQEELDWRFGFEDEISSLLEAPET